MVNILKMEINHPFSLVWSPPRPLHLFGFSGGVCGVEAVPCSHVIDCQYQTSTAKTQIGLWSPWLILGDASISPSYRTTCLAGELLEDCLHWRYPGQHEWSVEGQGSSAPWELTLGALPEPALPDNVPDSYQCWKLWQAAESLWAWDCVLSPAAALSAPLHGGGHWELWQYWEWANLLKLATFSLLL